MTTHLPPVSNKASWSDSIIVRDVDSGEALDLTDAEEITLRLREPRTCAQVLEASLSGGSIERETSTGTITFTFTADQMGALCPQTYEFGLLITWTDGSVDQVALGRVPVLKGL